MSQPAGQQCAIPSSSGLVADTASSDTPPASSSEVGYCDVEGAAALDPRNTISVVCGAAMDMLADDSAALSGNGLQLSDVAVQPDVKVLLAQTCRPGGLCRATVSRLSVTGVLDASFGQDGAFQAEDAEEEVLSVAVLNVDNVDKVVLAGRHMVDGASNPVVLRLTSEGALDTDFGQGGRAVLTLASPSYAIESLLRADGSVVIATNYANGDFAGFVGLTAACILDPAFGSNGTVLVIEPPQALLGGAVIDDRNRIVAAGSSSTGGWLTRWTASGAIDRTFGTPADDYWHDLAVWLPRLGRPSPQGPSSLPASGIHTGDEVTA
jgi:uncharacterized delta-60 repeat protein